MTSLTANPPALFTRPFLRHLGEMILAMLLGPLLIGPLWPYLVPADLLARADMAAATMATGMVVTMSVWMWHRGHGAGAIAEMAAAMYVPYLVLLVPWWLGLMAAEAVTVGGHLLMVPAMVLAMWHRAAEYTTHRPQPTRPGPWAAVLNRWPTAFALLVTADNLVDPRPLPAWTMLVLPLGYLLIGAVRRTLRPRRVLITQLVGLAAYLLLVLAATVTSGDTSLYLIGAGWLAHAGWDAWHHRRNAVVPRGYAEWCFVVDAVIGLSVIAFASLLQ
ncbi:hypothetical protein [Actinoplanes sp. NBRC 103695]|uniref:hypothetical protein n=1 Tax=Actinoplanes sp. NBRC 103695 TaxID=3032202 RepID=UPI0024A446A3|nr:hypothetical protein [Actinoplanes sp. NBRC 103695]GLZ02297.1 hypothetical protein Acsp02_95480 [Actinoplanes sp. NBRC 103695]